MNITQHNTALESEGENKNGREMIDDIEISTAINLNVVGW